MGWSQVFIDSLDAPVAEVNYVLRFIGQNNDYNLSFGTSYGKSTEVAISTADVTIDSVSITPVRWSVNFGGFSIQVAGDLRTYSGINPRKGAIAELFIVRNGIRQRVSIGQLRSIRGGRGVWNLEFVDFLTMLQSRLTTKTGESDFWFNAGKTAKVTQSFNYSSDTRLYLDDVTIFEKETGKNGVIFVQDSQHSVTGYWTWDTKTITSSPAGYLNIVDVGIYPSESTHDHLQVNDVITSIARLRGRPDYIFARLVMSTGNGTQGPFDDYPKSWGAGINWNPNLFNLQDLNSYYQTNWATSTGSHEFSLMIAEAGNIMTFLDYALSVGMFPVWVQNGLSWRVCQNPNQASWFAVKDHITDRDIVSIDDHEIYASSQSNTYKRSKIRVYNNSTQSFEVRVSSGTSINTIPAADSIERDMSLIYRVDNPLQTVQADKDLERLQRWDKEPYEQLSLTLTEKHSVLTAGDIVEISSNYIYGIREASGKTYSHRRAMVLSVRWIPSQSTCSITFGVLS